MNGLKRGGLVALAMMSCAVIAEAEPMTLEGTITDVLGHRLVVQGSNGKTLVDLGPKARGQVALKSGDKVTIEGNMKRDEEMKADRVTLSDGRIFEVKKKETWMEWLTGKKETDAGPFTADAAKKLALAKGYAVSDDPVSRKKHFVAAATKNGKSFELDIHRDGTIEERMAFSAADAKRLALDKGYTLTSDPVAERKHYKVPAMKEGKSFDLDIHADGRIEEKIQFSAADARRVVSGKGYEVVSEPAAEKNHFAVLTKKAGHFYEVHAHRDGDVKQKREVDKTDLRWGPMIQ